MRAWSVRSPKARKVGFHVSLLNSNRGVRPGSRPVATTRATQVVQESGASCGRLNHGSASRTLACSTIRSTLAPAIVPWEYDTNGSQGGELEEIVETADGRRATRQTSRRSHSCGEATWK